MGSSKYKLTRHKKNGVNAYPKTLVEAVFWDKEKRPLAEVLEELEEGGGGGGSDIDTVEVSVDSGTGTPSGTGSVSGSTLSLAFHNLKGEQGEPGQQGPAGPTGATGATGPQGPQGNTGSSVAYPYELVNNLTTDDATKGLSAAMGKNIEDRMPAQVDESGWYLADNTFNVAIKYDADGLDAAKVSDHFKSLLGGGGGSGDLIQVAEDGLYFVDAAMNIGAYIDEDGVHAPNIGEGLEYDIIS